MTVAPKLEQGSPMVAINSNNKNAALMTTVRDLGSGNKCTRLSLMSAAVMTAPNS